MNTLYYNDTPSKALMRGAATLFDLSGTGVFPLVTLSTLASDREALRNDFETLGEDFATVLRTEAQSLKEQVDGR